MMRDDDEAWQQIVDNYGDRVLPPPSSPGLSESPGNSTGFRRRGTDASDHAHEQDQDHNHEAVVPDPEPHHPELDDGGLEEDELEPFEPPEPPPLPRPAAPRLLAWLGVLLSPVLLLVATVAGYRLESWMSAGLVVWFVGGFGYLVWHMSNDPGDPWDDGARV